MAGLPLGVAPSYSIVGGISGQGHAGPGAGNSIFGQARFEDDKPWLQTLSGRRGMQPNIAHQMNRIGADGVVRDPLGSGAEYRHDGFVAAAEPSAIPTEDSQPNLVWTPSWSDGDLQGYLNNQTPGNMDKLKAQLDDLQAALLSSDPGDAVAINAYFQQLTNEYSSVSTSGFNRHNPTAASQKYFADAVSTLASYTNVYNETDLFPHDQTRAINAIVEMTVNGVGANSVNTLKFFMFQVQEAYLAQRGVWSSAQLSKMAEVGGWPAADMDLSMVGTECQTLANLPDYANAIIAIAEVMVSGSAPINPNQNANAPWGVDPNNPNPTPTIWGIQPPSGSGDPTVIKTDNQFDEAVFRAAGDVHLVWLDYQTKGHGGNIPETPIDPLSPSTPVTVTPGPSDFGYIAAGIALVIGLLAFKAYN